VDAYVSPVLVDLINRIQRLNHSAAHSPAIAAHDLQRDDPALGRHARDPRQRLPHPRLLRIVGQGLLNHRAILFRTLARDDGRHVRAQAVSVLQRPGARRIVRVIPVLQTGRQTQIVVPGKVRMAAVYAGIENRPYDAVAVRPESRPGLVGFDSQNGAVSHGINLSTGSQDSNRTFYEGIGKRTTLIRQENKHHA
jgi:hypothetical protein